MGIQKNQKPIHNYALTIAGLFCLILPSFPITGKAQEAQEMQGPPAIQQTRILPSKITPVQNNNGTDGLSKAAPDVQMAHSVEDLGALEALTLPSDSENFELPKEWKNLSREDIIQKLGDLSLDSEKDMSRNNIINIISTISPPADETPDQRDQKTLDIYSIRLAKLLQFGELQKVLSLYKMNEGIPPTSQAAEAGVSAMFWAKQTALACLEQKALPANIHQENPSFWDKVGLFCNGLLGPASGEDETLKFINASRIYVAATGLDAPDTIEKLNSYDQISLVALGNLGKLSEILKNSDATQQLADLPLSLLLAIEQQDPEIKQILETEATHRGLIRISEQASSPLEEEDQTEPLEENVKTDG
ncbi:MAG: hypothetical protein KDJ26_03635 [Alphaproteobacteria bacterium]|nr:hypothetical protein [Alphaproteobacteria bacterium]MCB9984811.1 hypothetical protein [Micavibrio sp.]HRK97203.1 hypothetical protein [Alphaproteobacteria bacterium]